MINKFKMKNLRNSEFILFHEQTLSYVFDAGPEELGVNEQYNKLKEEWSSMEDLFGKERGSALTKEIRQADERRDRLLIGSRTYFESFTYHDDEEKVAAGKRLLISIDRYGKRISKKNYFEESAFIHGIIRDWEGDQQLLEVINLLNAGEWKDALKEANEHFDSIYIQRIGDQSAKSKKSATSMKVPVTRSYDELIKHLISHATIAEDKAPYTKLIKVLNRHIKYYDRLLKKRGRNNQADDKAEKEHNQDGMQS